MSQGKEVVKSQAICPQSSYSWLLSCIILRSTLKIKQISKSNGQKSKQNKHKI